MLHSPEMQHCISPPDGVAKKYFAGGGSVSELLYCDFRLATVEDAFEDISMLGENVGVGEM